MRLSNYNVNQQLSTFFNHLLTQTPVSFPTLKAYLVNKSHIIEIHQQIIDDLTALSKMDKVEDQASLEEAASKR